MMEVIKEATTSQMSPPPPPPSTPTPNPSYTEPTSVQTMSMPEYNFEPEEFEPIKVIEEPEEKQPIKKRGRPRKYEI